MKLETDYTVDELKYLINKHKGTYLESEYKRILSRIRKIKDTQSNYFSIAEIKEIGFKILGYMGFQLNIYYTEVNNIVESYTYYNKPVYGEGHTQDILALSIVTEVLDYYNSKYNILDLIQTYNIEPYILSETKTHLNKWCKNNYWKN